MDYLTMDSLKHVTDIHSWPMSVWVLLLTAVVSVITHFAWRPSFPSKAPPLGPSNWPILGALRYFSNRGEFLTQGIHGSKTGNFSFYWGKLQVVNVAGTEGRKFMYESKELHLGKGYGTLFAGAPEVDGADESISVTGGFLKGMAKLMRKENFVRNLPKLVGDSQETFRDMVVRHGGADTGIVDPFVDLYTLVYQLTMRTVGATEIAENPVELRRTLRLFEKLERSTSPIRLVFPGLPTFAHLRRTFYGARLYFAFSGIIEARKKEGRREEDAVQMLVDQGENALYILAFVLGALFAGQLNSGINAAWGLAFLGHNEEWQRRLRDEVDGVVARHRSTPGQTSLEVLMDIDVDVWEREFPLVDLCLRETIRHTMVGNTFRLNESGRDLPIGNTGEILPRDAFAVNYVYDTHMNPDIYTDPARWDPGRFLPERAEDKKVPHAYLGWGVARHPCAGMRFAKLEMNIMTACFAAAFEWTTVDADGKPFDKLPKIDENRFSAHKPYEPIRLKYKVRKGAF